MPSIRQTSFAGGEVSPSLWKRHDLKLYGHSVRRMRNVLPLYTGIAMNRGGTKYIANTRYSLPGRLIPFIYGEEAGQSIVLVFTNLALQFIRLGQKIDNGGGVAYEIITPYTAAQLSRLKFAQVGDVLTIVHPDHPPKELKRFGDLNWTLTDVDFSIPAFWIYPNLMTPYVLNTSVSQGDVTNPPREWRWQVTSLFKRPDGTLYETMPVNLRIGAENIGTSPVTVTRTDLVTVACTPTFPITIRTRTNNGLYVPPEDEFICSRIYKGRGSIFGFVGETKWQSLVATMDFIDNGIEPDYSVGPPQGRNPFEIKDGTGAVVRTERPSVISYFEQRRVFGGTRERPGFIFFSKTNRYNEFDRAAIPTSDDAMEFELASMRYEEIRSLVGLRQLYTMTNSTEWSISGAGGEAIANDSILARAHTQRGSSWLDPLVVGNMLLHVQPKGHFVRELAFSNEQESLVGADLTLSARHFFNAPWLTAVDWSFEEDPHGIVWMVRSDGKLVSLTYSKEFEISAWAEHDVSGVVTSVCSIPEADGHRTYFIVKRVIQGSDRYYLEYMPSRNIYPGGQGYIPTFLDCHIIRTLNGANVITGLSHLEDQEVTIVVDSKYVLRGKRVHNGQIYIGDAFPDGATTCAVGLGYTSDIELLDVPERDARVKNVREVSFEVEMSKGLWVGPSLDQLDKFVEWKARDIDDSYEGVPLRTEIVNITIPGGWKKSGRAAIQQRDPFPMQLISVTREVEVGGY